MITKRITSGKEGQLKGVVESALDKILKNLTEDQADQLLKVGNLLQDDLAASFQKHAIVDKQFGADLLKGKGSFTVPADYSHNTQIDDFVVKTKDLKSTYYYYYNSNLSSKNFAKATTKLVPGKTYAIKMFPILETVESEDCLNRLKSEPGNVLVGAQGVTALHNDQPDIFPVGKYTVSFDDKEALWEDAGGRHGVPSVYRDSGGARLFGLGYFERSWGDDCVLVCICDLESSDN